MNCFVVSLKFVVHGPKFTVLGLFANKASAVTFQKKLRIFFETRYCNLITPADIQGLYKTFPQCDWKDYEYFYLDDILLEECEVIKK